MRRLTRVLPLLVSFVATGCNEPAKKTNNITIDDTEKSTKKHKSCGTVPASIDEEHTIKAGCTLDVDHNVVVEEGGKLVIEPGVKLVFAAQAVLLVRPGGSLTAKGTGDEPIVLTADKAKPGRWAGVLIGESAEYSDPIQAPKGSVTLDHVVVEYGGFTSSSLGGKTCNKGVACEESLHCAAGITLLSVIPKVSITDVKVRRNLNGLALPGLNRSEAAPKIERNVFEKNEGTSVRANADRFGVVGKNDFGEPIWVLDNVLHTQTWKAPGVPVRFGWLRVTGTKGNPPVVLTLGEGFELLAYGRDDVKGGDGSFLMIDGTEAPAAVVAKKVAFKLRKPPEKSRWLGVLLRGNVTGTVFEDCSFVGAGIWDPGGPSGPEYAAVPVAVIDLRKHGPKDVTLLRTTFSDNAAEAIWASDCGPWIDPGSGNSSVGEPLCAAGVGRKRVF
jgi:hypothetical protein